MTRFLLALSAAVLLPLSAALPTMAQTPPPASETPVEDEVVSEGTIRGSDPAMSAFFNGDFETAEIEFERNFSRIKRGQALARSAIDQNGSDAETAQLFTAPGTAGGSSEAQRGLGSGQVEQVQIFNVSQKRGQNASDDPNLLRSGDDLGFQLYMSGLSEMQLGKYSEARESLSRALTFNRSLHDAHLRLGLLDLNEGDKLSAAKRLETLVAARRACKSRCKAIEADKTLDEAIDTLAALLSQ